MRLWCVRTLLRTAAGFSCCFGLPLPVAAAVQYSVTVLQDIPGGGTATTPAAINDSGLVVGGVNVAQGWQAATWTDGVPSGLPDLPGGGFYGVARGLNNLGQIVGTSSSDRFRAVIWDSGQVTQIGPAGLLSSEAYDINDLGQIILTAGERAYIWNAGSLSEIPSVSGAEITRVPHALNNRGMVVGETSSAQAFISDGLTTHLLANLVGGPDISTPLDINDAGAVVGHSYVGEFSYHATLWVNGFAVDLGDLAGGEDRSSARGVNNRGQVVGVGTSAAGLRGVIWNDGVIADLTNLIDPAFGWRIEGANGINDAGQIIGWGTQFLEDGRVQVSSILLTPFAVPEPAALALVTLALFALSVVTSRLQIYSPMQGVPAARPNQTT